jgi:hypothetical protein
MVSNQACRQCQRLKWTLQHAGGREIPVAGSKKSRPVGNAALGALHYFQPVKAEKNYGRLPDRSREERG